MGLATFLDQEAEKSDSATKAGATIFPVVMSASKARQIAAELRAKDKEIEYQRGERETAQIELARLCTALDAAHAERDAAQKVITDAYNIMITPYHADATSDDATSQMVGEHQRVTEMLANALSSHPAAPAPTAQPAAVEATITDSYAYHLALADEASEDAETVSDLRVSIRHLIAAMQSQKEETQS